jgi:hypothetical protein
MPAMNEPWYEIVPAEDRITQGDLVLDCPILGWDPNHLPELSRTEDGSEEVLHQFVRTVRADLVVMTQACDLEHNKVANVVLCPHLTLSEYRSLWAEAMTRLGQNPSEKAWRRACDDIANGYVWNQAFLNGWHDGGLATEHRIVEFHEVYTLPRALLESILAQRKQPRLRVRPPYREHLSQAFARFFMRGGLPTPLDKVW